MNVCKTLILPLLNTKVTLCPKDGVFLKWNGQGSMNVLSKLHGNLPVMWTKKMAGEVQGVQQNN